MSTGSEALVQHVRGVGIPVAGSPWEAWWVEAMRLAGHQDMLDAHARYKADVDAWRELPTKRCKTCSGTGEDEEMDASCSDCLGQGRVRERAPPNPRDYYPPDAFYREPQKTNEGRR